MSTEHNKYKERLQEQLKNFNLERAETLSVEIHDAEIQGYTCSQKEEYLWADLSDMIIAAIMKKHS